MPKGTSVMRIGYFWSWWCGLFLMPSMAAELARSAMCLRLSAKTCPGLMLPWI